MENFFEILIVGSALSLIIQFLKSRFGTEGMTTKIMTLVLALVFGAGYYFLQDSIYWENVLGILGAASGFYAFFLKK